MANISLNSIVTRVQNLLGTDAQLADAEIRSMALSRYELLYDAHPWAKRRKDFTINLTAASSNGANAVVLMTSASSFATSSSTPFTSSHHGLQIKVGSEQQYYFASFVSTSQIALADGNGNGVNWPNTTVGSNNWRLFQTVYNLPSDADLVLSLNYNYPLDEFDGGRPTLDNTDPDRQSEASDPTHWCYLGVNTAGTRQVEIWPVPLDARTLRGQYMAEAPQIGTTSTIEVHPAVFTYAVAADCYGMLYSKTGDESHRNSQMFYEKKATEGLNDILPYEVARNSPPRSLRRRTRVFGRGTDWETDHDLDLLEGGYR